MKLNPNRSYLKTIIFSLVFLLSMTGVAFAQSSQQIDYVALGDSLAAGSTPVGTLDKSYTDFIAEKLDGEGVLGDYHNFGVAGYTTDQVLASIDSTNPENINRIASISNAEIITLDIGANDLKGLIPGLLNNPDPQEAAKAAIGSVAGKIFNIVVKLKQINPNAKIYLMGYYNAFPYYPEQMQEPVMHLIKGFNQAIQEQVAVKINEEYGNTTYIDTYTTMDKHLTKYLPEDNIHPDIFGYRAIAKDFWNIIKVDFLRGLN